MSSNSSSDNKRSSIFQPKTKLIEGGGAKSWNKMFVLKDGSKKINWAKNKIKWNFKGKKITL
jgi:hypothetical protein